MREFETAVKQVEEEDLERGEGDLPEGAVEWMIHEKDGEEVVHSQHCIAYKPNDGQIGMFLATTGRHSGTSDRIAGIINLLTEICDHDTHSYLADRLLDREDPFGLDEVTDIINMLVEEWSGKASGSRSVSASSQKRAGRRSTPTTPVSV